MKGGALALSISLAGLVPAGFIGEHVQSPRNVTIDVVVSKSDGSPVTGLSRDDFLVEVDGSPRTIERWSSEQTPVSVLLLFDVSVSASVQLFPDIVLAQDASAGTVSKYDPRALANIVRKRFLDRLLKDDRIRLASFGRRLLVGPPFTADRAGLLDATVTVLRPDPAERIGPTPIWDVAQSAVDVVSHEVGRRAIVIVTDGEATGARLSVSDVARAAAASHVPIHVVSLAFDLELPQERKPPEIVRPNAALRDLAEGSGGLFLFQGEPRPYRQLADMLGPPTEPDMRRMSTARWSDVGEPLERVAKALHQGYSLTVSLNASDAGKRRLQITVRRANLEVHAPRWVSSD